VEMSRDVDEGISIPDIDTLIEVDFLYGIGNQSKKNGRLLQGRVEASNQHILITERLFNSWMRFQTLFANGFLLKIEW